MKVLKIIGLIFMLIFSAAALDEFFSSPGVLSFTLTFIILFFTVWLFCSVAHIPFIEKIKGLFQSKRKIREKADNYYTQKCAEADEYSEKAKKEADEYTENARKEANSLIESGKKELEDYKKKVNADIVELNSRRGELQREISVLELDVFAGMVKIDAYEDLRSDEIKNQLTMLQGRQDELVRSGEALKADDDFSSKRIMDSQKKQILRCFNAECSNILEHVTVKNVDASRAKIQRSFEAINRIFAVDGVQISQAYLASKFEELSLIYAYMVKEEEEKEQRRAIREQMLEEEKVRREIERQKQKIEKEEAQFSGEVKKMMGYLQKSRDDAERQLYIDKIKELEEKLKAVAADKENVLQREQNTRAGFVYIISNIGSFGEQVFKIGMTRRLEPMDRINELSSASVPFPFDVHAMIFSEDAPALEAVLHQHFNQVRVNRVNQRKEFFKVDLEEIKKVVLENHNATVKFVDIPNAVEYRETLRLESEEQE